MAYTPKLLEQYRECEKALLEAERLLGVLEEEEKPKYILDCNILFGYSMDAGHDNSELPKPASIPEKLAKDFSRLEKMLSAESDALTMLMKHREYGPKLFLVLGKIEEIRKRTPAEWQSELGVLNNYVDEPKIVAPANVSGVGSQFIRLENICCTDADGNVFERYGEIYVQKSFEKKADGERIMKGNTYSWIVYFEQKGMFLPSFALSCNILAALWQNRNNPECMKALMEYKDRGDGKGWHNVNTIVDYTKGRIIHYPLDSDFPNNGGVCNVNAGKRKLLQFDKKELKSIYDIQKALKIPAYAIFVRQLTGLINPGLFEEIGDEFGTDLNLSFPHNPAKCKDTRSVLLGCDSGDYFSLSASDPLHYGIGAGRGISLKGETKGTGSTGPK